MRWLPLCLMLPCAAAAQDRVTIDTANCQLLMRHAMAPDVAYRPGVDVQGRAVVPADLSSDSSLNLPRDIPINIEIPVRTLLGANSPYLTGDAKIEVGQVVVRQDGRVLFNGQLVTDEGRDQLIAACRRR
jgi:hypothetical protein